MRNWFTNNRKVLLPLLVICLLLFIIFSSFSRSSENQTDPDGGKEEGSEDTTLITDVSGPFTVTYLGSEGGQSKLRISDSSPVGRARALEWIKEEGFDLTKAKIYYSDFSNPLAPEEPSKNE